MLTASASPVHARLRPIPGPPAPPAGLPSCVLPRARDSAFVTVSESVRPLHHCAFNMLAVPLPRVAPGKLLPCLKTQRPLWGFPYHGHSTKVSGHLVITPACTPARLSLLHGPARLLLDPSVPAGGVCPMCHSRWASEKMTSGIALTSSLLTPA